MNKDLITKKLNNDGMVVFKKTNLTFNELLDFSKQFGELELVMPRNASHPDSEYVRVQDSKNGGANYWHSDMNWGIKPCMYTILFCIISPRVDGETLFINAQKSVGLFNQQELKLLSNCTGIYDVKTKSLSAASKESNVYRKDEIDTLTDFEHSLIVKHPINKKLCIQLNEKWLTSISYPSISESSIMLTDINHKVFNQSEVFTHKWEKGDLIIWDNYSILHKGGKISSSDRKITYRITIKNTFQ